MRQWRKTCREKEPGQFGISTECGRSFLWTEMARQPKDPKDQGLEITRSVHPVAIADTYDTHGRFLASDIPFVD